MTHPALPGADALLAVARGGDERAFEQLIAPYRASLHAHCYRMLGSVHDADDALQDALLGAWRGLAGFEGRSSLRTWLYTITTNACLGVARRRPARILAQQLGPAADPRAELAPPATEVAWLEPYPDADLGEGPDPVADPEARYDRREAVELAFVAALQHLPANQRAVLVMREVLGFPAAEVAGVLDTSVPSVNSALQRARATLDGRLPVRTEAATRRALGDERARTLLDRFVGAWERADVGAILDLLAEDVAFTMPPLPAWFAGREDVGTFVRERVFATPWRFRLASASGQPAMVCYQGDPATGVFGLGAFNVLTLTPGGDRVAAITAFLDPAVHARLALPVSPSATPPSG
jgi:RNA polymerase sigma-70 factor (TIGR02960 family)